MRDVFGARDDQVGHFFAFLRLFGGHAAREKKRSSCEVCENSPPRRFCRIGDANEVAVRCALQTGTRSMSFEQVHVIGEELTAQIASASFSSRMRLRSSSAETQKRIGVYR